MKKINRIDLINNSNKVKAKTTRRLGGYLIDIFIVSLLATILSIVIDLNLIPNLPLYKDAYNEVVLTQQETYKALNDTKLIKFNINEKNYLIMDEVDISSPINSFKDYTKKHIEGVNDNNNDSFQYYYLTYRKNYNLGNVDEYNQKYINTVIYSLNENPIYNTSSIWEYNDINDVPKISDKYKENLKLHLDGEINQETQKYYNNFYDFYLRVYKVAIDEFVNSEKSIYPNLYKTYIASGEDAMSIRANTVLICVVSSLIIYHFAFTFIFGNGESVGKRIMRLSCIDKNKEKISVLKVIFKNLILIVGNLYICSFPVIFLGNPLMFSYLFKIGDFQFKMFYLMVFAMIISLISLALALFSKSNSSLDELITRSEVIDLDE